MPLIHHKKAPILWNSRIRWNKYMHHYYFCYEWYHPYLSSNWHPIIYDIIPRDSTNAWIWFHFIYTFFCILIYRFTLARRYYVITGLNTIGWIHPSRTSTYTGGFWGKKCGIYPLIILFIIVMEFYILQMEFMAIYLSRNSVSIFLVLKTG